MSDAVIRADGVITAANASQISDGSAALLIMTSEKAKYLGLTPTPHASTQTEVPSRWVIPSAVPGRG